MPPLSSATALTTPVGRHESGGRASATRRRRPDCRGRRSPSRAGRHPSHDRRHRPGPARCRHRRGDGAARRSTWRRQAVTSAADHAGSRSRRRPRGQPLGDPRRPRRCHRTCDRTTVETVVDPADARELGAVVAGIARMLSRQGRGDRRRHRGPWPLRLRQRPCHRLRAGARRDRRSPPATRRRRRPDSRCG